MKFDLDYLPSTPRSETEWLLQWGDAPVDFSKEHIHAVQMAVESLSPESRYCIEAVFYEGIPYSELGKRLGVSKPHAWRLSKRAMGELQRKLWNDHSINLRYKMFDCWDDASLAILEDMDHFVSRSFANMDHMKAFQRKLAQHVRDHEEIPVSLFTDVGDMACGELKMQGQWRCDTMHKLLVSKQHDYGHNNILMFGHTGIAIRMCDKIARLFTLQADNSAPANESLVDTWRDLVGYSVIALMLWNETFTLDLKGKS
jgi:predicted DNA-binding protein (UPF0251 family)